MTSSSPLLALRDLSVAFRTGAGEVSAVRDVSLELAPGETLAVVGESGSGKSTTAAAINRLLPGNGRITAGKVLFEGRDLASLREKQMTGIRGAQIGLVPQDPMSNLNPLQRIGHQIEEALTVHGKAGRGTARGKAVELLELVGIPDPEKRVDQYPHEFSGGMRQRVLIAIGLACRPRLLIADEPTSALDVTVQRRILDQLALLTQEMGTSVFLITHDLGLAAERADRMVVMRRGEIVESGDSAQILSNPEHEYTKQLIAAVPSLAVERAPAREAVRVAGGAPDARADDALVRIDELTKVFTLRGRGGATNDFAAVDSVSFDIPRGRTVAIVGESGSGKSTTANLVLALETPTSGRIDFEGTDMVSLDRKGLFAFRRRVQPVFQNPYASLDPRFPVGRSIAEPLVVHRIGDSRSRRDRVVELLEQVALAPALADRLPHELSGGQRQRVAIARALALSPDLVVLDEAVSALDVVVQAQVLDLLAELQQQLGLSYLFISHDLAVVRMVSDVVHVMQRGRFVESGTPEQIFGSPQQEYTRELLAAIPRARAA
ncbi:ABC transporter ATP-binding protein [Herbiconiux flava]|uniref:Peptide/nickel transport system ATP-binding protein n=1 Tax=Herbiconiux flava TaxID=881268 RepID=A0A852SJ79_9MICO|nr:ABC transporter ATP-binding protein [Herbiconiux flava]NYD69934.1 peptide/nickel transport system ATP-binding protein [Herbiconiux flava]